MPAHGVTGVRRGGREGGRKEGTVASAGVQHGRSKEQGRIPATMVKVFLREQINYLCIPQSIETSTGIGLHMAVRYIYITPTRWHEQTINTQIQEVLRT